MWSAQVADTVLSKEAASLCLPVHLHAGLGVPSVLLRTDTAAVEIF